jgi:hypothetical protein
MSHGLSVLGSRSSVSLGRGIPLGFPTVYRNCFTFYPACARNGGSELANESRGARDWQRSEAARPRPTGGVVHLGASPVFSFFLCPSFAERMNWESDPK